MMTRDYHDYIFKDGKFIGDFDAMYRNCADPWGLDATHQEQISYELLAGMIAWHAKKRKLARPRILEIGSGKGYFCGHIAPLGEVTGLEVAPTALAAARANYPALRFVEGNIIAPATLAGEHFDVVVMFKGLIWYVIDHLDAVKGKIRDLLAPGGLAIIEVNYYHGDYYGKNLISGEADAKRELEKEFRIVNIIKITEPASEADRVVCSYYLLEQRGA